MRLDAHLHQLRIFRTGKLLIGHATHRTVALIRRDLTHFFDHWQLRPRGPVMAETGRLLPTSPRTGCLRQLFLHPLFALLAVEPVGQIADLCSLGLDFLPEGRLARRYPFVLGFPVVRCPLEVDVFLLRQHHRLLSKRHPPARKSGKIMS
jgi:hypothetical protein